jgi:hypothetical protein
MPDEVLLCTMNAPRVTTIGSRRVDVSDGLSRGVLDAVAGVSAGLLVGVLFSLVGVFAVLGSVVGVEGAAVGWAVHLVVAAVLGVAFGVLVTATSARRYTADATTAALLGLGYGGVIWAVGEVLWVITGGPVLANVGLVSLIGWLLFGLMLGSLHALFGPRADPPAPRADSRG